MNIDLTDLAYLKKQHLHFAILNNRTVPESFLCCLVDWIKIANQFNINWTIDTSSDTNIPRARNVLVARFLQAAIPTHIVFIDPALLWEPWHILALLSAKKHIVGGICSNAPTYSSDGMCQEGDIYEVINASANFLMISREGFEHLDTHSKIRPFKLPDEPELTPFLKTFFSTQVQNKVYEEDDYVLCSRWADLGGKTWIHNKVQL